jgi:hypothetical protein
VVYIPPFRDPYNYNLDGLVMNMTSELGTTMHSRLVSEGKGGSGSNSVGSYSTWHNGMVRSTPYYHNAIGILTELIGGPTPEDIALVPDTQLARNDIPLPMVPRRWHLRDSIDYQWSMNRAVIDYASRNRERLLFNIWRMGMNAIERGSTDTWQMTPTLVDRMKAAAGNDNRSVDPALMDTIVRTPENRMPRGYIINPQTQRDLPTTGLPEHPDQERGGCRGRGSGVQREWHAISGGFICREDGAGLSPARARYVRAAGPPAQYRVSGRTAQASVRCGGLYAGLSDGRDLRPDAGRF